MEQGRKPDFMQRPADIRPLGEPQSLHIALLGAVGTGKTRLASDLRAALVGNNSAASRLQISDSPPLASLLQTGGKHNRSTPTRLLLMGLDLPAPQGIHLSQAAADLDLRQTLCQASLPYSVVYGLGAVRLHNALYALHVSLSDSGLPEAGASDRQRPWVWACDSCSDPGCERRLLSALLAGRPS